MHERASGASSMNAQTFVPGIELCGAFYREAVKPILEVAYPDLRYASALIGPGSEVLGLDTEMSTDHHWGPRVMLFLGDDELARYGDGIRETLSNGLPHTFRGYSTHFTPPDPNDNGTQLLAVIDSGLVNHRVETLSLRVFCRGYLGIEPDAQLTPVDWLTIPGQKLLAVTSGAVYRDDIGDLTRLREKLAEYPHDIWLYMLAAGWTRIGQEEHFMGRTGFVGDDLGSRIIAARLVHDLMNLCFLMERRYPPYSKWFGTAFARLDCAGRLTTLFHAVFDASNWREREEPLIRAYSVVAEMHNATGITEPLPTEATNFFGRPFRVVLGEKFADAIRKKIRDPEVQRIARTTAIGALEQFSTSTDVLSDTRVSRKMSAAYT